MPRVAALLLLAALFTVLVAARFQAGDWDRLTAVGGVLRQQIQPHLPETERFRQLSSEWWHHWPRRPVDDLRHRLATDARLQGIAVTIVEEDNSLRLRGIVPSEEIHQIIHELATHTLGIDAVVDELAVVAPQTAPSPENPSPQ
ncbi:MAG: hypothetical protein KatS3mg106_699 [Gemmataceae bacterium]|nr:MAG: hypothetical protein KatS3mg106_699 [Gemmataceae bacterium]